MVEPRQMNSPTRARVRCAIYTRKSSEEGLEQEFNSLDAQREACEAYITSQKHEGWTVLAALYDDGAYSGGTMDRPALQRLLDDVRTGKIADSGHRDQPIRLIVITQTGDRDHAAHLGRGVPGAQHGVALVVTTDGCSLSHSFVVFVKHVNPAQ